MILVKTRLKPSSIHGIGLFADELIPRGTVVWAFDTRFEQTFTEDDLQAMSEVARKQIEHYAYIDYDLGKYVLCFDDYRFINHSSHNVNLITTATRDIAARDILAGEELLCDYRNFDHAYFERRGIDINTLQ